VHKLANRLCCFLLAVMAVASGSGFAQTAAPDALMRAVTVEVTGMMRQIRQEQNKDIRAASQARLHEFVTTRIVPLFDFDRMTEIAVARNWHLATPEQKRTLAAEFQTLLVRTYSTALSSYRDQVIEFKRLHAAPGDTAVIVKSVMRRPGTEALTMDYDMEKKPDGWKVYDITVDGISLISTYRETFSDQVKEGGIARLIAVLNDKNRQDDAHFRFPQTETVSVHSILRGFMQGAR